MEMASPRTDAWSGTSPEKWVILTGMEDSIRKMLVTVFRHLGCPEIDPSGSPSHRWSKLDPTKHQGTGIQAAIGFVPRGSRSVLMCMQLTQPGARVQPHLQPSLPPDRVRPGPMWLGTWGLGGGPRLFYSLLPDPSPQACLCDLPPIPSGKRNGWPGADDQAPEEEGGGEGRKRATA